MKTREIALYEELRVGNYFLRWLLEGGGIPTLPGLPQLGLSFWYSSVLVSTAAHGSAKATKIELSCLNEIPLQMSPKGMWGPENMKIKNFRWGLFEFYIFLY